MKMARNIKTMIKITKNGEFCANLPVFNRKKGIKFGPGKCCTFRTHPQISITKPEILCELKVAFPNFTLDINSRVYLNDNFVLERGNDFVLKKGDSFTVENYKIEISWDQIKPQKTTRF